MIQACARWFVARFLFVGYVFISVSPAIFLMRFTDDPNKPKSIVTTIIAIYALGAFVASWWLSNATARHLIDEQLMFLDALKQTWFDARLRLAFFPVIGPLFTPDEDKTRYDDDDDVRNFNSSEEE